MIYPSDERRRRLGRLWRREGCRQPGGLNSLNHLGGSSRRSSTDAAAKGLRLRSEVIACLSLIKPTPFSARQRPVGAHPYTGAKLRRPRGSCGLSRGRDKLSRDAGFGTGYTPLPRDTKRRKEGRAVALCALAFRDTRAAAVDRSRHVCHPLRFETLHYSGSEFPRTRLSGNSVNRASQPYPLHTFDPLCTPLYGIKRLAKYALAADTARGAP